MRKCFKFWIKSNFSVFGMLIICLLFALVLYWNSFGNNVFRYTVANNIDNLYAKHYSVHISLRADAVVNDLADSGEFEEWDIKICLGGIKTIQGHTKLERPIAEESRNISQVGGIFRRRQLYARIFALYMHDEKTYDLLTLEDMLAAKCHNNDTLQCLYDWDYVWERVRPSFRASLGEESQVDMFYKLVEKAPQH